MSRIRLALAQQGDAPEEAAFLAWLQAWCEQAAAGGAHLLLLPELWSTGYRPDKMNEAHAWHDGHPALAAIAALAQERRLAVGFTYLARHQGALRNRLRLYGADGRLALQYDKVHICDFADGTETALQGGDGFACADVALGGATVRIGAMICFDREFPEAGRALMRQGAELVLTPNACRMREDEALGDARLQQLRGRALENRFAVALCNYPAPLQDGASCLIDARGRLLALADDQAGILFADLDLSELRRWRTEQDEVWGTQALRPDCYR
ncbi:carbon-nitrogen hydrolase family protein [Chromobacterium sp. IIBBL 290-4]|uniref:carbon-nitrogen hydrolase family protein n=1 Tax=Chromobacterium sp. IIBBL 290-4 TaxID=2953890 RepID=UPI0020B66E5A|nr:carbon-nitrogen hydrolase family protein [Chromobacterium sp. IIBBL 290-4]UTH74760.1 carbon-nitrogen hydrolase family protein [Chromobacterium sp. IIBBL 290-4]